MSKRKKVSLEDMRLLKGVRIPTPRAPIADAYMMHAVARCLQHTKAPPDGSGLSPEDTARRDKWRENDRRRDEARKLVNVWATLLELCAHIPQEMMLRADVTKPPGHMGYIVRRYDRAIRAHEARESGLTYMRIGRELGVSDKRARQLAEIGRRRKPTRESWANVLKEYGTASNDAVSQPTE